MKYVRILLLIYLVQVATVRIVNFRPIYFKVTHGVSIGAYHGLTPAANYLPIVGIGSLFLPNVCYAWIEHGGHSIFIGLDAPTDINNIDIKFRQNEIELFESGIIRAIYSNGSWKRKCIKYSFPEGESGSRPTNG